MKKQWLLFLFLFAAMGAAAQADTTARLRSTTAIIDTARAAADTVPQRIDTVPPRPAFSIIGDTNVYARQPFFRFTGGIKQMAEPRQWQGKEPFFYAIIALLIFFALVRNGFRRYTQDLFGLFFRTSLKQRQVKEHIMQAPLPSLLLNILFFLSGGLFINLLFQYRGLGLNFNFWVLLLYCIGGLAAVYTVKFLSLKISGWLFRLSYVTDVYAFIVFTTNKVIGIALLPFLILLSFTTGTLLYTAVVLSLVMVGGLFLYRYFLSYVTLNRQVKFNLFHFLLYLLAFEIIPLLLINKVLLAILSGNA